MPANPQSAVTDQDIRKVLYLSDSSAASFLGVPRERVAKIRAGSTKLDTRLRPGGARSPAVTPDNGLGSALMAAEQTRAASHRLLVALLLFGCRHNGLPNMTREMCRERARDLGAIV